MILTVETDGIYLDAKLLVIGLRSQAEVRLWKLWDYAGEKEMVHAFVDYLLGMEGGKIIIGFNVLKFDVPILLHKASGHPRFDEFFRRLNSSNIIDLFTILTFLNDGVLKGMDYYCEKLGVKSMGPKRDEVATLWASRTDESRNEISRLVSLKMNTINDLFLRSWGRVRDGSLKLWEKPEGRGSFGSMGDAQ